LFTRTTGYFIVPVWIAAMTWVVGHDAWPALTALPAPRLQLNEWLRTDGRQSRYTISDSTGEKMGTVWSEYRVDERSVAREDLIWIDRLPMGFAPVRINVYSVFTVDGVLDEFTVRLQSQLPDVELHGERFHSDFSFALKTGTTERAFKVPLIEGGVITGAFHPFGGMTNLGVGQRWRMQVVNPLATLTGMGERFIPLLVEVVGEERLRTSDGDRNCFVIESERARAWVDASGNVLLQEVNLPVLGTLRIERRDSFDERGRTLARNQVMHRS
jgi:hypothetical protein